ncbi:MAG: LacI family transcriptional regulator, partial [Verrucomicrobia bacterium]
MEIGRPSMRDIARILNISHATVSMALRNNPRISKRRREQVQRVAKELGYRPDPMLSSLAIYRQSKQARPIAATLAWINRWSNPRQLRSYSEYDQYWRGAEDAARRLGYRLDEFPVGAEMSGKRLNDILLARGIQGILIPPHNPDERWIDLGIDWQKFAIVRFGFGIADLRADVIGNDQMRSAELAVSCIHKNGYRAIGFVTDHLFDLRTGANFRMGYLRAMEMQGLRTIPPLVLP